MDIKEIPQVLFKEFSEKLGQGEEREVVTHGRRYLLKELNPELAGFSGAIGFSASGEQFYFVLWPFLPEGEESVFEAPAVLTIAAGSEQSGEWSAFSGNQMIELCRAKFPLGGICLHHDAVGLIPSILQRASELTATAQSKSFWDAERCSRE